MSSRKTLAQVALRFLPPPRSVSQTKVILRELRKFGKIEMFKVKRHETLTKGFTPSAHLIYAMPSSVEAILSYSPFVILLDNCTPPSPTEISVTALPSDYPHSTYTTIASASLYQTRSVRSHLLGRVSARDLVDFVEETDDAMVNIELTPEAEGKSRAIKGRVLRHYTNGFQGLKYFPPQEKKEKEGVSEEHAEPTGYQRGSRMNEERVLKDLKWVRTDQVSGPLKKGTLTVDPLRFHMKARAEARERAQGGPKPLGSVLDHQSGYPEPEPVASSSDSVKSESTRLDPSSGSTRSTEKRTENAEKKVEGILSKNEGNETMKKGE